MIDWIALTSDGWLALVGIGRRAADQIVGENAVQLAAGTGEHLTRGGDLRLGAGVHNLPQCATKLVKKIAQLARRIIAAGSDAGPSLRQLLATLLDVSFAGFSQLINPLALGVLANDQALVFQQLERGIDRTWTWPPVATAAGRDLLDQLVAVERLFGQQHQSRHADIAAPSPGTALAAPAALAELATQPIFEHAASPLVGAATLTARAATAGPIAAWHGVHWAFATTAPAWASESVPVPSLLWIAHVSSAHHSWTFHRQFLSLCRLQSLVVSSNYLDISIIQRQNIFVKTFWQDLSELPPRATTSDSETQNA